MKELRYLFLIILSFSSIFSATAQADRFAYAVTDSKQDGMNWIVLRKINIRTGEFSQVLLDGIKKDMTLYDAENKQRKIMEIRDTNQMYQPQLAFASGVAALAYDRKNNRVFYIPQYVDQLRYIDLSSMKVYCVHGKGFYAAAGSKMEPMSTLPRLVIAGDGYGYSISNDGNHLFRFSTDGTPKVEDLGSLIDAKGNNENTIHNACGTGGGDMIADDDGNLYLITAQNQVYKTKISTLETSYLGKISGLPEKFNTNGAAVDDEGRILVSSSTYNDAWFKIDPSEWKAYEFKPKTGLYRSSDLANSNLLVTSRTAKNNPFFAGNNGFIKLYPNPAEKNVFMVRLTNIEPGDYSLKMTDISGRTILEKKIAVKTTTHTETVFFPPKTSVGLYLVRIGNRKNSQVFSEKVMLNRVE
ncbi:T9SS type A sorting domain-containing protein [Pollutibacter soli]|uniref:T9SS type A sorting domain-containing protein n=1 Tax=Pollutibacter soli TaxID=3034157 RepID=UPI003013563A